MNRLSLILAALLFALTFYGGWANADTIRLKSGEEAAGRVLGVTDNVFYYLEEKSGGISMRSSIPADEVAGFSVFNLETQRLRDQVRSLERDNRVQQKKLDDAIRGLGEMSVRINALEKTAERLRSIVDSLKSSRSAVPSPIAEAPSATAPDAVFPSLVDETSATESASKARIIVGNVRIDSSQGDGKVTISGRMINRGVADAHWVKFRVYGYDYDDNETMNVVRYARRAVLRSGESEDFSFQVTPSYGTVEFSVVPEWE